MADGNKRTAVAAADVHLRINGLELGGDSMEHHRVIIGLMEVGSLDWRSLDGWIRASVEESGVTARRRRQKQIGSDLSTPLDEDERAWLERD